VSEQNRYELRLSLSVLDDLGLNLYSNIPAVRSEIVANAWDADASVVDVEIDLSRGRIVVSDDGIGMSFDDINKTFLRVGYPRRTEEKPTTKKGRHVMGRKEIGKLSLFATANTVEVQTAKCGDAGYGEEWAGYAHGRNPRGHCQQRDFIAATTAVAAGAILAMLPDRMIPEAF
jgi:hypothetical protein